MLHCSAILYSNTASVHRYLCNLWYAREGKGGAYYAYACEQHTGTHTQTINSQIPFTVAQANNMKEETRPAKQHKRTQASSRHVQRQTTQTHACEPSDKWSEACSCFRDLHARTHCAVFNSFSSRARCSLPCQSHPNTQDTRQY